MIINFIKFKIACLQTFLIETKEVLQAVPKTNWLKDNLNNKYSFYTGTGVVTEDASKVIRDIPTVIFEALFFKIPGSKYIYKLHNKNND